MMPDCYPSPCTTPGGLQPPAYQRSISIPLCTENSLKIEKLQSGQTEAHFTSLGDDGGENWKKIVMLASLGLNDCLDSIDWMQT